MNSHGLNNGQYKAVTTIEGPLLIVAGAGAGKTKTLTHRIAHIIDTGVRPEEILAVTFTNKAAGEMRERVRHLLKERGRGEGFSMPFIGTFHSLGVLILKESGSVKNISRHFSILDESDAVALVKEAIQNVGLDPKTHEPRKVKGIISRSKGDFLTQETYQAQAENPREFTIARIWEEYEKLKNREQGLDFDDLLLTATVILQENKSIREMYQERWKYVHIDEYQDTNEIQYRMATLLSEKHHNICVVGDSDQTIYSWRGANIKNILNFEHDYPDATTVLLEENYRSSKTILDAANTIIQKNKYRKEKNLYTSKEGGDLITLFEGYDERAEAEFVADAVSEALDQGTPSEEIAVLYRANFQSRALEEAFLARSLPYHVLGVKFFDRKEVKDIIAYIRASLNPGSFSDIKRVINTPVRGIGKTTVLKVLSGLRSELPASAEKKVVAFYALLEDIQKFTENHSPSEIVKYVYEKSGYRASFDLSNESDLERAQNIEELVTLALRYDDIGGIEGLEKLIEDASLMGEQDSLDNKKATGVRLMTVHASKGLEFDIVFITGLEQDLFPHSRDQHRKPEDAEEERRLFYVAVTRAKKKLYLTYAGIRTVFGMREIHAPSEFITDIPEELVTNEEATPRGRVIYID